MRKAILFIGLPCLFLIRCGHSHHDHEHGDHSHDHNIDVHHHHEGSEEPHGHQQEEYTIQPDTLSGSNRPEQDPVVDSIPQIR